MRRLKTPLRFLLAFAMIGVGITHFTGPEPFARIVPDWLGDVDGAVYASGVFEILGGAGLLFPRTQRAAAFGLIALFVAVFPANLHMALNEIQLDPAAPIPPAAAWARLPFQVLFVAWAWWYTELDANPEADAQVVET